MLAYLDIEQGSQRDLQALFAPSFHQAPFINLNLEQGSKEWHEARKGKITASIVANCIGVKGAFRTPREQALIIKGLKEPYYTSAQLEKMNKGLEKESAIALKAAEIYKDTLTKGHTLQSAKNPLFVVSLDAQSLNNWGIYYEFKYSALEYEQLIKNHKPSEKYYAQIQFQLFITGFDVCRYCVMSSVDESRMSFIEIKKDEDYQKHMLQKLNEFIDEYLDKEIKSDELDMPEALMLARELRELNDEVESKNARIAELKKELAKIGEKVGEKCYCEGVCIYPSTRTSIDYKGFLSAQGLEVPKEFIKENQTWSVRI